MCAFSAFSYTLCKHGWDNRVFGIACAITDFLFYVYVTSDKMCKFSESKVGERKITTSETEEKYNKDVELTDLRNWCLDAGNSSSVSWWIWPHIL